MPDESPLDQISDELHQELVTNILPYWITCAVDRKRGGFHGRIGRRNKVDRRAPKSSILNTRILWTFSAAYGELAEPDYLDVANRAYRYLCDYLIDRRHGGVYWSVDHAGRPADVGKHVYAQAFAIYGLAEYVAATGDDTARQLAVDIYQVVEARAADQRHGGYLESFSQDWRAQRENRLGPRGQNGVRTMNTHLHILESYTSLYRIWPDYGLRQRIEALLDWFLTTILDSKSSSLTQYFDASWAPLPGGRSFGHDIEASWLLMEAVHVISDEARRDRVRAVSLDLALATLDHGIDRDGGLRDDVASADGRVGAKEWWPQAEALVGFVNAYQETADSRFADAALSVWSFVQTFMIDRKYGGWFFRIDGRGRPNRNDDKVGPWKGPYHNARACLKIAARRPSLKRSVNS